MNSATKTLLIVALTAVAAGGGFYLGRIVPGGQEAADATTEPADPPPVVPVKTAPIRSGALTQTTTAYGTVQSQPGAAAVLSVPFESQIIQVLVAAGQRVEKGTELVKLASSPDSLLQLRTATNELSAATRQLEQAKDRVKEQLATQVELLTAQQAVETAQTQLDSLKERGVGESRTLTAPAAGLVSSIGGQPGQIMAAAATIAIIDPADRVEAKIGVNPEDAAGVTVGEAVQLRDVHAATADPVTGTVRFVAGQVNPDTRLTDIYISLPKPDSDGPTIALQSFVAAAVPTKTKTGLIVPRAAVLPDDDKWVAFTVNNGKAARHEVTVEVETDDEIEIASDELKAGDAVITTGNAELEDQMAVDTTAITQPATQSEEAR